MSIQSTVDLSILRYANCWEDADILLQALAPSTNKTILCIASAGDNALALLSANPDKVVAIDLSPVQLYVTELKQLAFYAFDHPALLSFLGVTPADAIARKRCYNHLKGSLTTGAADFWDEHRRWIEEGLIFQGKFEKYFTFFRRYLLPLVHSRHVVDSLFKTDSIPRQEEFYENQWNSRRWQWLMNFFFSRLVMGKYGRDPQFLKYVDVPVSQYIRSKAEQHLRSSLPKENHMLDMIFNGNFRHRLPFYLRPENFESIRKNISKLALSNDSAEVSIEKQRFDCYALSNIFEYVSTETFNRFALKAASLIPKGSRLAYWNLMAPRSFSEAMPTAFVKYKDLSEQLSAADKGFFYSRFLVEERT